AFVLKVGEMVRHDKFLPVVRDHRSLHCSQPVNRETGEPDDAKGSCPVRRGLGEKAVRTSLVAYPTVIRPSMPPWGIPATSFNVLVQWQGFQSYASGFVRLSMAEFSL